MSTPRPPLARMSAWAPTCGASRPATSDIGASSGSERSGSSTVSYAIAVTPLLMSASVQARPAAEAGAIDESAVASPAIGQEAHFSLQIYLKTAAGYDEQRKYLYNYSQH